MKTPSSISRLLVVVCAALLSATGYAQESVTTTTITQDGIVQQIVPASSEIVVTSPASPEPVRYSFTKTTTFVDAQGNAVTYESIQPNAPARIYYTRVGDRLVVSKFVVQPATPVIEETTTTTTTTTED
ncbi:MAG TPA: hypothetical protein VIT21_03025 [Chthoniobacterales bacterium]